MCKKVVCLVSFVLVLTASQVGPAQDRTVESFVNTSNEITFNSSDNELNDVFKWAKKQALAYAFDDDAVGPWYEAALPFREGFCMRDVAHQAMGAHFLGLATHTKNMLYKFAENISDSRDWCSLWEITRHGTPALPDYLNDDEFWYNLPANFDILDCCFRMYELTGDMAYLTDPVFLNFYKRTVYDYVERWDIGIDKVMHRTRLMHNSPNNNRKFRTTRGFPGYREGDRGYTASLDLLVTQQAAFEAYARFQQLRLNDEEALKFYAKAEEVENFINTIWWDDDNQQYYTHLTENHELASREGDRAIPYWGRVEDKSKVRVAFKEYMESLTDLASSKIEALSHSPEILYKYEEPELARKMLLFVSKSERREYPEASFCSIGAMVSGLMGIEMETFPSKESIETGGYKGQTLATKSRLTDKTKWAEMNHVPIKGNDISVRHEGTTKTTLTNHSGPRIVWKAYFPGTHKTLLMNGQPVNARRGVLLANGEKVSIGRTYVAPTETVTFEIQELSGVTGEPSQVQITIQPAGKTRRTSDPERRENAISKLPDELNALKSVAVPRDSYHEPGTGFKFRISAPAVVYISVHQRGGYTPPASWKKTDMELTWFPKWHKRPEEFTDVIYMKKFDAGVVEIPAHDGGGPGYGLPHLAFVKGANVKISE